jgi:diketogulonate reductase-like aldo/keto reductase
LAKSLTDCATLNNGVKIPWLGFGVFQMKPGVETKRSVQVALEIGYHSLDTAAIYENEESVGQAMRQSRVARQDIIKVTI